jgi:purine-cytosine permease-like protein
MNAVKRILGYLWMLIGIASIVILITGAIENIDLHGKADINKPVPWIIIIAVFTPIAIGLVIFGYYAVKDEYKKLPSSSEDLS